MRWLRLRDKDSHDEKERQEICTVFHSGDESPEEESNDVHSKLAAMPPVCRWVHVPVLSIVLLLNVECSRG